MVPLADTLRVFSIRIAKGRSPFSPDRNHIHHLLLDRGLNHKSITITCLLLNIFFIAVGYFTGALGPNYVMLIVTTLACSFLAGVFYIKKPVRKVVFAQAYEHTAGVFKPSTTKVVSMSAEAAAVEN